MRVAIAAVIGYVVYFICIAVTYSILWIAVGAGFAYHPGTARVTTGWLLASTPLTLIGAAFAGWLATKIAKRFTGAKALAALVLIRGLAFGVMNLNKDRSLPPGKSPATLSAQEAGQYSIQPTWYDFTIAVLAAGAVLDGGRKRQHEGARVPAA